MAKYLDIALFYPYSVTNAFLTINLIPSPV